MQPQTGPGMQRQPQAAGVTEPGDPGGVVQHVTESLGCSKMPKSFPLQFLSYIVLTLTSVCVNVLYMFYCEMKVLRGKVWCSSPNH